VRVRITEYLDANLEMERWQCNRCGQDLGTLHESYKLGCLLYERDPRDVHPTVGGHPDYNFSFHPDYVRIIEFYCPGCGVMLENEYLPPGHPLTWDIQLDVEKLKRKHGDAARQERGPRSARAME